MDTCVITQFNYQGNLQIQKNSLREKTFKMFFKTDFFRESAEGRYTEPKGMVILPMPQSFQEERAVQFGEDTMNTMAAGLTQRVLESAAGYLAAGAGASAILLGV